MRCLIYNVFFRVCFSSSHVSHIAAKRWTRFLSPGPAMSATWVGQSPFCLDLLSQVGGMCTTPVPVATVGIIELHSCIPFNSISCSVFTGPGSQFFDISNCSEVQNIQPIDLTLFPQYQTITLLIEVNNSVNVGYAKVNVTVIPTNSHAPNFTQPVYSASVVENAKGGTSVLTVTATDQDFGINGQIDYSILRTDPSFLYFQIDRKSGLITTKQPIDYEKNQSFILTVYATDEGSPPNNGSAIIYISVIDLHDVRPLINCSNRPSDEPYPLQPCFYNYDLKYDAVIGSKVSDLLLQAIDLDLQPRVIGFNQLQVDAHFDMSNTSGLITVAESVDAYTKYVLYVYAEDDAPPNLKSRVMYIRIDTYRPERQWIDLTIQPKTATFDSAEFLDALRNVTSPWFMKMVAVTKYQPNVAKQVIMTVYALNDTSTYQPENIADAKVFVDRDDMLKKLRKNIYGDPKDLLTGPLFDNFPVIKVMPSYVNWWLDTVEGIATITCLTAAAVIIGSIATIATCKAMKSINAAKSAVHSVQPSNVSKGNTSGQRLNNSSDDWEMRNRSSHARRASVTTVHSAILDNNL